MSDQSENKIFLNCLNSWFSNFVIEEFRTDYLKNPKIKNSFMGTLDNSGLPLPRLFEPKVISIFPGYNYNQEIFENNIFIFNLDDSESDEVEFVIRGLKTLKYSDEKILILVSNIMTWANTPLKLFTEEEIKSGKTINEKEVTEIIFDIPKEENIQKPEIENDKKEEIKLEIKDEPNDEVNEDNKSKKSNVKEELKENSQEINNVINNNDNEVKKEKKIIIKKLFYYKENDCPKRVPNSRYLNYKFLETLALNNENLNLKVYVICPGFIYGCGEDFFFEYFKKSWLGKDEYIPINGTGNNFLPTIHIIDLVKIIKQVIKIKPNEHYIFACDNTKNPSMKNIISSISKGVGSLETKSILCYNVDEIYIPNYCELSINVPIKMTQIINEENQKNYNINNLIDWHCLNGIPENMDILVKEFNIYRDIKPVKIIITGPPSSGKTTIAEFLSKKYKLSIFNIKNLCDWANKLDNDLGNEIKQKYIEIEETVKKALEDYEHRKNKRRNDPPLDTKPLRKFQPDFVAKLVKEKLIFGECVTKGYILDNYPKSYQNCLELYSNITEIENQEENLENEEQKKNLEIDKNLFPDFIIIINNYTEESLKNKLQNNPEFAEKQAEIETRFNQRLDIYKKNNEAIDSKKIDDFFNENNIKIIYVNETDYMANKENEEKKILEFLENNGTKDSYSHLCDVEDEITYLKPIQEIENEDSNKLLLIDEDNVEKKQTNFENPKNKVEVIKEDEDEETSRMINKRKKEREGPAKKASSTNTKLSKKKAEQSKLFLAQKKSLKSKEKEKTENVSNEEDLKKIIEKKLYEMKEREKNILEKKSEVLRRYLSENVMPLLAKGILNVCHNLPDDPVEALANFLLDNSFDFQKDLGKPNNDLEKIMQDTEH